MTRPAASRDTIDPDAPIVLDLAVELAFPDGSVTVRTLRTERDKGRLVTWRMGRREYTSLVEIGRMIDRCRDDQRGRASGSTSGRAATRSGSSSTVGVRSAPDAARAIAHRLKRRSPNTSREPD